MSPKEWASRLAVISLLLSANPAAVLIKNSSNKIVLDLSLEFTAPLDVIILLVCADLPVFDVDGSAKETHGYSWTKIMDHKDVSVEWCKSIVSFVLSKYPTNVIHELAHAKDERGREAVHIAHKDVRLVMNQYLYFCGRYELLRGPPVHRSATAVVYFAIDHSTSEQMSESTSSSLHQQQQQQQNRVALKFMQQRAQFEKELHARTDCGLDDAFVMHVLRSHEEDGDANYRKNVVRLKLGGGGGVDNNNNVNDNFPYCLVMPAAERNLKTIIDSEHIAGRDWDKIRRIAIQIVRAIGHMHSRGLMQ